ncbi:MAG: hypothetical protein KDK08_05605 [Rhizobiaceae bacterium]|nr:hypothetical protein [Rhizobiaceae bacterium]MCC0000944.1 hypothetical protein [Methylobacteriaceae bacterium]
MFKIILILCATHTTANGPMVCEKRLKKIESKPIWEMQIDKTMQDFLEFLPPPARNRMYRLETAPVADVPA